jgi:hypothetical protein
MDYRQMEMALQMRYRALFVTLFFMWLLPAPGHAQSQVPGGEAWCARIG